MRDGITRRDVLEGGFSVAGVAGLTWATPWLGTT